MLISRLRSPTAASVFNQILWWIGNAIEALILARSIKGKLYEKYPAFYFYLSTVLLIELLRFAAYTFQPSLHRLLYWYTEYLVATVGYGVILEIYKHALKSSPGAARIARVFLLGVLAAVILKVVANALTNPVWSPATTLADLERDLRAVQALLLFVIVALLAYYRVPVGRNLKGIAFGYGLYVCVCVMSLAFDSLPAFELQPEWRYVQRIAYLAALSIWAYTLWSYRPIPQPEIESEIERNYKILAGHTMRVLSRARSFLKLGGEL